jgi:hypothetical protein
MKEEEIEQIINEFYEKRKKGMELSQIRNELSNRDISPEIIKLIVREVDETALEEEVEKTRQRKVLEYKLIGYFLFIGGILFTFLTYQGIIDLKGYYIIAYGPVAAGIIIVLLAPSMAGKTGRKITDSRYFDR